MTDGEWRVKCSADDSSARRANCRKRSLTSEREDFPAIPPAAKLAFLLFGPVFDLKLFWLYGLIFRRRFVVLMALGLFALIAFICWIWAGIEVGIAK